MAKATDKKSPSTSTPSSTVSRRGGSGKGSKPVKHISAHLKRYKPGSVKPRNKKDELIKCPACDGKGHWILADEEETKVRCRICRGAKQVPKLYITRKSYNAEDELLEDQIKTLPARHEKFCQLYASQREFFGNGVKSYMEVYPDSNYNSAMVSASAFLRNPNILNRINDLLEDMVLNDAYVDKQLGLLITQNADGTLKLNALKEYNRLRQRILTKIKMSGGVESALPKEDRDRIDAILAMNS